MFLKAPEERNVYRTVPSRTQAPLGASYVHVAPKGALETKESKGYKYFAPNGPWEVRSLPRTGSELRLRDTCLTLSQARI